MTTELLDIRAKNQKIGVILLSMGGPSNIDEVRPFLYNLFSDPDIIRLPFILKPFQKVLAWIIAKFRSPKTIEMYKSIGNGSPQLLITQKLAQKTEEILKNEGYNINCFVCMRYTSPRADEIVDLLENMNITDILLFTQYPHFTQSTTGSSFNDFYKTIEKRNRNYKIHEIKDWGSENFYLNWWVRKIEQKLVNKDLSKDIHLIFSVHGLPKRYIDAGEDYPLRISNAVETIISQLGVMGRKVSTHLSYQSQTGPIEWTRPYTIDLLEDIASQNPSIVILIPFGFVSNHVETLYEIDIFIAQRAKKLGIENFSRVDVPDANEEYVNDISRLISQKLDEVS